MLNIIISIIHGVNQISSSVAHTPAACNGDYHALAYNKKFRPLVIPWESSVIYYNIVYVHYILRGGQTRSTAGRWSISMRDMTSP